MKIALLNLPFDNNYGGNLQRYALTRILQDMGHDVTYLYLKYNAKNPPLYMQLYKSLIYLTRRLIGKKTWDWTTEVFPEKKYRLQNENAMSFVEKYIPHTAPMFEGSQLVDNLDYEVFLVGSDQVWRKSIAKAFLPTMFFDYLPATAKRIAYSVSLGSEDNELTDDDIKRYGDLYSKFSAVSVREESALKLLKDYGWLTPNAVSTLDPTLLLNKEDYIKLVNSADTVPSDGKMFCYILDPSQEKTEKINAFSKEHDYKPYYFGINRNKSKSIEQWLRSFMDAEFVITDSFHGLVFSIIFNKPFLLFKNEFRGNARFDSICNKLGIDLNYSNQDWTLVNQRKQLEIAKSKEFLINALK